MLLKLLGEEQCPRDDLFSLIFVFCDLVCGKLPWSEAAKAKDKMKVSIFKKQYLADPRRFLDWLRLQSEEADTLKVRTPHTIFTSTNQFFAYCLMKLI